MLEILNIPELHQHMAPISIERYHRMIELGVFEDWDVELINGVLVEKMSKSELHVFLVQYLVQQLNQLCPPDKYLVRKEDPITIGNSEPEPDISVVQGTVMDFRTRKPATAELVIEVAIHSSALDRAKGADYARAGVKEFLLIEPIRNQTTKFGNPSGDAYLDEIVIPAPEPVISSAINGFTFRLADLI